MSGNNVTLYAICASIPTYAVTYSLNGDVGTLPIDSLGYIEGEEVTLSSGSGLTFAGISFLGLETELEGEVIEFSYTMGSSDVTFLCNL